jgi:hypothetical protein
MDRPLFVIHGLENIHLPSVALWGFFFIGLAFFVGISVVLIFHWHRYSMKNHFIWLAELIYISVAVLIILGAITSLTLY